MKWILAAIFLKELLGAQSSSDGGAAAVQVMLQPIPWYWIRVVIVTTWQLQTKAANSLYELFILNIFGDHCCHDVIMFVIKNRVE